MKDDSLFRDATGILKVIALGAHRVSESCVLASYTLSYLDSHSTPRATLTGKNIFLALSTGRRRPYDISQLISKSSRRHPRRPPFSLTSRSSTSSVYHGRRQIT